MTETTSTGCPYCRQGMAHTCSLGRQTSTYVAGSPAGELALDASVRLAAAKAIHSEGDQLTIPGMTPPTENSRQEAGAPLRPFWRYFGAKWRSAPHYPAPRYPLIIEPFAGAAGYSVRHHRRQVMLIDRDPVIVATWRYLQCVTPDEILGLPDIEAGTTTDDYDLSDDQRRLVGWWMNHGVTSPRKSPSGWLAGGDRPNSMWGPATRSRIASQLDAIRHWIVGEGEYSCVPDIEATWFVDPPYTVQGKHYRHGCKGIDYADLAEWCRTRRGQVIVCEQEGADWLPFRPLVSAKATRGKSAEVVWTSDPVDQDDLWRSGRTGERL